jgi:tetratricopeptide (TPR) repeat protein
MSNPQSYLTPVVRALISLMDKYATHDFLSLRVLVIVCFVAVLPSHGQNNPPADLTIPAELTPSNPEIRTLLGLPNSSCNFDRPDARIEKLQKAMDIAEKKGLIGDRAVLEAGLASVFVSEGKLNEAFPLFQKGLQDSIDAGRQVLEADILTSVASLAQVRGNTEQAIELVNKALSMSEQTGNLYGNARALGELGRLKLLSGKKDEGWALINKAVTVLHKHTPSFWSLIHSPSHPQATTTETRTIEASFLAPELVARSTEGWRIPRDYVIVYAVSEFSRRRVGWWRRWSSTLGNCSRAWASSHPIFRLR